MTVFESVTIALAIITTPSLAVATVYTLRANRRARAGHPIPTATPCRWCDFPAACPHCETCAYHCDMTGDLRPVA